MNISKTLNHNNGEQIFYQMWTPTEDENKTVADIIITHGMAEHSECYRDFALNLNDRGYRVWAYDLTGHGKSSGKRGYVKNFNQFREDLSLLVSHISGLPETNKIFLFGHSMGGLITLDYLNHHKNPKIFSGALLSSPALGILMPLSQFKINLAKILVKIYPKITMSSDIPFDLLTHDNKKLESFKKDKLRHNKGCPEIYFGMLRTIEEVSKHINKISIPILFQLAEKDFIVDSKKAEQCYLKIESTKKKIKIYDNLYHEIFNEAGNEPVYADLFEFLGDHI